MDNEGKTIVSCKHAINCIQNKNIDVCKIFDNGGVYNYYGICKSIKVDWTTFVIFKKHFIIKDLE